MIFFPLGDGCLRAPFRYRPPGGWSTLVTPMRYPLKAHRNGEGPAAFLVGITYRNKIANVSTLNGRSLTAAREKWYNYGTTLEKTPSERCSKANVFPFSWLIKDGIPASWMIFHSPQYIYCQNSGTPAKKRGPANMVWWRHIPWKRISIKKWVPFISLISTETSTDWNHFNPPKVPIISIQWLG